MEILLALALFQLKHLVGDFFLQTRYQLANKGTYGHPGGILHSGIQSILTQPILFWAGASPLTMAGVFVFEFVVHYHLDWAKEAIGRKLQLSPDKTGFWWALGIDQALHQLSYIAIIWIAIPL